MTETTALLERLYGALNDHDAKGILSVMAEDFSAQVSAGMPLGVGGRHEGRQAMLREVWAPVFAAYDLRAEPERFLVFGDGTAVVVGRYVGTERATGRAVDARFAHVLEVEDGLITGLEQITDTRRW